MIVIRFGGDVATSSEWRWNKKFVYLNFFLQFFLFRLRWGWWVGDAPGVDPVKYVIEGPIVPFTGWYWRYLEGGDTRFILGRRVLITWGRA